MAKILPTFTTLVRHFSSMDSLVLSKVVLATEGFSTLSALVRPLASVDPVVLDKRGFAAEGLPAVSTLIRLFSTMCPLVLGQRVLAAESFPTFTALVTHLADTKAPPTLGVPGGIPLPTRSLLLVTTQRSLELPLLPTCKRFL